VICLRAGRLVGASIALVPLPGSRQTRRVSNDEAVAILSTLLAGMSTLCGVAVVSIALGLDQQLVFMIGFCPHLIDTSYGRYLCVDIGCGLNDVLLALSNPRFRPCAVQSPHRNRKPGRNWLLARLRFVSVRGRNCCCLLVRGHPQRVANAYPLLFTDS